MANPTKSEAKKNNNLQPKKNLPRKFYFGREGVFVGLDKDNFIGVVAYTRVDLIIYAEEKSNAIEELIKKISRHVKYLIDSCRIGSDDIIYDKLNTKYMTGKTYMFQSIYIPYTNVYGKFFSALKRLKSVENEKLGEVKASFSFRTKNSMRIIVKPNNSRNEDVFLKGYISSSLIPPAFQHGEFKTEEKFILKSGMFVNDGIGFTFHDIFNINRKELTKNTVSLFGKDTEYKNNLVYVKVDNTEFEPNQYVQYFTKDENGTYKECEKPLSKFEPGVEYYSTYKAPLSTFIPFKRRVNMVIYQADSVKSNGVVNFYRESFEIGLMYRTFKSPEGKIKEDFGDPLGIFIKVKNPDTLATGDIADLIRDRSGRPILYGADNNVTFDMETFKDEASVLNENFIATIEKLEDPEPKPEQSKKNKKKSKSKKEKKETSEKEEKMENNEEVETFNNIGSLADIDENDESDDLENNVEDEEAAEIAATSEAEAPVKEETSEEIELPKEEE